MKSFDTNILIYAANRSCPEHPAALAAVEAALDHPSEFVIAEQVLFELYRAVRNPRVFSTPLKAREAANLIAFYRNDAGFSHCCYETTLFERVHARLTESRYPFQRTHDTILEETLAHAGVQVLLTRNTKDFAGAPFEVVNPID